VIIEPVTPDGTDGVGGGPGMDAPPFGEAVAGGLGCLGGDLSQDGPRLKRNALAGFAADHGDEQNAVRLVDGLLEDLEHVGVETEVFE
jgi:hypothetical protein